jgi:hypothetical protein
MVLPLLDGCPIDAAQIPNLLFLQLVPDRQSSAYHYPRLHGDVIVPLENGVVRSESEGKPTNIE